MSSTIILSFTVLVGLALTYALSITQLLNGVVKFFTETEKMMVSVERAQQYIERIPHEREIGLNMVTTACFQISSFSMILS